MFAALVDGIVDHGDYYLVSDDFNSYCKTQDMIDEAYKNQEEWVTKCITSVARMGFFSSDRCIDEVCFTMSLLIMMFKLTERNSMLK